MRSFICACVLAIQFISAGAFAGKKTDEIAFWDLRLASQKSSEEFMLIRERVAQAVQAGADTDQIFYLSLKEAEVAGRLLGHMILDLQQLEALQLQLQWGARAPYLLGSLWTYERVTETIGHLKKGLITFSEGNRDLYLGLFALAADKRLSDAKARQALVESIQAQVDQQNREQSRFSHVKAVWRWLSGKSYSQEGAPIPLVDHQKLLNAPVTDEAPILLPRVDQSVAISSEFADQLIHAYWSGVSSQVGHLLGKATHVSHKVLELVNFTRRIKGATNLSQLDGSDVKQSCAFALASKKRN